VRGEKVYTLKPDREHRLWELQITTLVLPQHLEQARVAKNKEEIANILDLSDAVGRGPTSLDVCAAD
jgi:hypothetical protein